MDHCEACGFTYDEAEAEQAGGAILAGSRQMAAQLRSGRPEVTRRAESDKWSPLEYGGHLRDVLLVQRERVLLARRADCPTVSPMGRDERVEHDGYREQDPDDVARQLEDAAAMFVNDLARVDAAGEWERLMVYNYPTPSERTLRWVAVHTEHEVRHHLADVTGQLG